MIYLTTEHLEVVKNSLKRVRALRIELEFGKVGFWREEKTGTPREKRLGKEENQQQTYPFIYLKHEKGTLFGRSLPIKAIIGSTHPPGERRQVPPPPTTPPLRSFRRKPIHLLYLHKKVSSFMSISLIYNNCFAKFVPVNFLIKENVTLGLMFAVCRKCDSKSFAFPLNDYYNP